MRAMHSEEVERRRRVAAKLASTLAPLVDAELASAPAHVVVRRVAIPADRELIAAAQDVASAVFDLDQAQFVGGREVAARKSLERAARRLRARLQKRGLADV